jgi:pimeloyl-ACP methyl ester carboxylesterase
VTESTASARSLGQQRPAEPGWPPRQRKPDGTASCSGITSAGGRRPLLHSWFPQVEDCTIEGVGHLLHIQRPQPVAQAMAEFLAWNPMTGT